MSAHAKEECRFFTGIQHNACAAGIAYGTVRDVSGPGMAKWPCLTLPGRAPAATTCAARSLLTADEQAAREAEIMAVIDKAATDIAAGKCPHCGAPAEPSTRSGRCIYNACGHRRGQALDESEDA